MTRAAPQRPGTGVDLFPIRGAGMTDAERESAIACARMKLTCARFTLDRRRALDELHALIAERSEEQIARMEKAKGLR